MVNVKTQRILIGKMVSFFLIEVVRFSMKKKVSLVYTHYFYDRESIIICSVLYYKRKSIKIYTYIFKKSKMLKSVEDKKDFYIHYKIEKGS